MYNKEAKPGPNLIFAPLLVTFNRCAGNRDVFIKVVSHFGTGSSATRQRLLIILKGFMKIP